MGAGWRSLGLFVLLSTLAVLAGAGIYKWVDSEGNVQYGDSPPATHRDAEEIRIVPGPHEENQQRAQQRADSLRKQADELARERRSEIARHESPRYECVLSNGRSHKSNFPCEPDRITRFGKRLAELYPGARNDVGVRETVEGLYFFASGACEKGFRDMSPEQYGENGEPFFPKALGAAMARAAREICP